MRKSLAALGLGTRCLERPDRGGSALFEWYFQRKQIHRSTSHFAAERRQELVARLARGETAYVAGISIGGFHNSGVALIEVRPEAGLRSSATTKRSGSRAESTQTIIRARRLRL